MAGEISEFERKLEALKTPELIPKKESILRKSKVDVSVIIDHDQEEKNEIINQLLFTKNNSNLRI